MDSRLSVKSCSHAVSLTSIHKTRGSETEIQPFFSSCQSSHLSDTFILVPHQTTLLSKSSQEESILVPPFSATSIITSQQTKILTCFNLFSDFSFLSLVLFHEIEPVNKIKNLPNNENWNSRRDGCNRHMSFMFGCCEELTEWKTYEGWGFNPMLCVLSDYTGKAGSQLLVKSDDWY